MPSGWDSYAFFAISPRHLEAVITKTAQVLVEGRYSGVLEPESAAPVVIERVPTSSGQVGWG